MQYPLLFPFLVVLPQTGHLVPRGIRPVCGILKDNDFEPCCQGFEIVIADFLCVFQLSLTDEHKKLPSGTYQVRVFDEEGYAWLRKVRR